MLALARPSDDEFWPLAANQNHPFNRPANDNNITSGLCTRTKFAYDGLGRRLKQSVGATETRYLWCGDRICQQRSATSVYQKRFYAEGEYFHSGTKKYLTLTDHLGSVRDVIDITGTPTLVRSLDYRPYGAVARSWGTVTTGYTYAGLFAQANTGLLLSTTRAYNPANGKWLNVDPIREAGGINLTGYVRGGPISRRDLLGLLDIFIGGAGDGVFRPVKGWYDRNNPGGDTYFPQDSADQVIARIRKALAENPNEPINIIGHSNVGTDAGDIAAQACDLFGKKIDLLITIDQVGRLGASYERIKAGAGKWINVDATGPGNGNFIAMIGGEWGRGPDGFADVFITAPNYPHADFGPIMDEYILPIVQLPGRR